MCLNVREDINVFVFTQYHGYSCKVTDIHLYVSVTLHMFWGEKSCLTIVIDLDIKVVMDIFNHKILFFTNKYDILILKSDQKHAEAI